MFTDDPVADFLRHDAEQERAMDELPVCVHCGISITDEVYWNILGEILCEEHAIERYRKWTDDYIG